MSREIDLSKKLSKEDRQYLADRDQWNDIRANDEAFADEVGEDVPNPSGVAGVLGTEPSRTADRTEPAGVGLNAMNVLAPAGEPGVSAADRAGAAAPVSGDYSDWSKEELQDELGNRELPKSGNKSELVRRLQEDDQTRTEE